MDVDRNNLPRWPWREEILKEKRIQKGYSQSQYPSVTFEGDRTLVLATSQFYKFIASELDGALITFCDRGYLSSLIDSPVIPYIDRSKRKRKAYFLEVLQNQSEVKLWMVNWIENMVSQDSTVPLRFFCPLYDSFWESTNLYACTNVSISGSFTGVKRMLLSHDWLCMYP